MTERIREFRRRTISLALAGIVVLLFFLQCFCITAYADEAPSVLDDFNGTEFNIEDYPEKEGDYSLNVIQVAETNNGELFVYVYQPSAGAMLIATSIRFSTSIGNSVDFHDKRMDYVDSDRTIFKYRVRDFEVLPDNLRYYAVAAIHRKWSVSVDGEAGNVQEIAYPVDKLWTASTVNGEVSYTCTGYETIKILDSEPGLLRYSNGVSWFHHTEFDSHFIAFKANIQMDELLSAKVGFVAKPVTIKAATKKVIFGEAEELERIIVYDDPVTNENVVGWLGKKYKWKRISRASEFVANHELEEMSKSRIAQMDWVLEFYETTFKLPVGEGGAVIAGQFGFIGSAIYAACAYFGDCEGTVVTDVTIVELTFKKGEDTYAMGVVDDKHKGAITPSNTDGGYDIPVWLYFVGIAVVILVVLVVLSIVCPQVLPPLFNGVWLVVSAPFKLMSAAVQSAKKANEARKERKAEREAEKDREEARKERNERKREREERKREREADHDKEG